MKKRITTLSLLLLSSNAIAAQISPPINDNYAVSEIKDGRTIVYPEVPTFVTLSNMDRNRIVCNKGTIYDARSSNEKRLLQPQIVGNEAFLKWQLAEDGGKAEYANIPTEIYIKCGNDRYTLIAIPKEVPAATVYLSSGLSSRVETNEKMFKGKDLEERIVKVVTSAYNNDLPESWTVKVLNEELSLFDGIRVILKRKVSIEGSGMDLYEYEISVEEKSGIKTLVLDEDDFALKIDPENKLPGEKLGASFSHLVLNPGMTSRFFFIKTVAGRQP